MKKVTGHPKNSNACFVPKSRPWILPPGSKNSSPSLMVRSVENLAMLEAALGNQRCVRKSSDTLQGINISHLGKRKIIFKMPFLGDMLVPWRVLLMLQKSQGQPTRMYQKPRGFNGWDFNLPTSTGCLAGFQSSIVSMIN